jgi:type II secretory pathway pseudopilin PulG
MITLEAPLARTVRPETVRTRANRPDSIPRGARRGSAAGFTIVEVMMAVIVMAFAITTSITTMQRGFSSLDTARNITIAGQIMQSEFEKMRLLPWTTIDAYAPSVTSQPYDAAHPEYFNLDTAFTSNAFIGNRFTVVRDVVLVRTGLKKITLTISWKSYDGRTLSRKYFTYYGQNGLYDYFYNSL